MFKQVVNKSVLHLLLLGECCSLSSITLRFSKSWSNCNLKFSKNKILYLHFFVKVKRSKRSLTVDNFMKKGLKSQQVASSKIN